MNEPLLQVTDLKQYFPISRGYTVKAVNGVPFCIYPGETYHRPEHHTAVYPHLRKRALSGQRDRRQTGRLHP